MPYQSHCSYSCPHYTLKRRRFLYSIPLLNSSIFLPIYLNNTCTRQAYNCLFSRSLLPLSFFSFFFFSIDSYIQARLLFVKADVTPAESVGWTDEYSWLGDSLKSVLWRFFLFFLFCYNPMANIIELFDFRLI